MTTKERVKHALNAINWTLLVGVLLAFAGIVYKNSPRGADITIIVYVFITLGVLFMLSFITSIIVSEYYLYKDRQLTKMYSTKEYNEYNEDKDQ